MPKSLRFEHWSVGKLVSWPVGQLKKYITQRTTASSHFTTLVFQVLPCFVIEGLIPIRDHVEFVLHVGFGALDHEEPLAVWGNVVGEAGRVDEVGLKDLA